MTMQWCYKLIIVLFISGLFRGAILQSGTEMRRTHEINMGDDQNYMLQVKYKYFTSKIALFEIFNA